MGNYAGVTVDAKFGYMEYRGYRFNIADLPGTYSLSAYSPEEKYVMGYMRKTPPDVIVNVVVASNLERNLYLTTELIDMNRSMVVALNMYDELERSMAVLDEKTLGKLLGVPMVPTVASSHKGLKELLDTVIDVYELRNPDVRHIHVNLGPEIEKSVTQLKNMVKADGSIANRFAPRYVAIKLLEHDPEMELTVKESPRGEELLRLRDHEVERLHKCLGEDPQAAIASEKYGFIAGALGETLTQDVKREHRTTSIIDAFVTNKLFGFPLFLLVMWLMFWCTFTIGQYPMDWIEAGVDALGQSIEGSMSAGPLKSLIVDGIIGGVGSVIVFLPQILILYAFISFMEASGYMARVAFIMDKLMHHIGLHGKSFIPLLMGFGCNVPAIMGHARHREPVVAPADHTHHAVHELLGQDSAVRAAKRMFLPGTCRARVLQPLSHRHPHGHTHGQAAAAVLVQGRRDSVRDGAASLPHPHLAHHADGHVGKGATVYPQDGRHHIGGLHHNMGPLLFPACREGADAVRHRIHVYGRQGPGRRRGGSNGGGDACAVSAVALHIGARGAFRGAGDEAVRYGLAPGRGTDGRLVGQGNCGEHYGSAIYRDGR